MKTKKRKRKTKKMVDPASAVCITHGRFLPCRKDGAHNVTSNPFWVKSVATYQSSAIEGLTWEPMPPTSAETRPCGNADRLLVERDEARREVDRLGRALLDAPYQSDLDQVRGERDALAAKLARVEALRTGWAALDPANNPVEAWAADELGAALADDAPTGTEAKPSLSFVDKVTHEPCGTRGELLCTSTDPDHRHIAAHMVNRGGAL